MQNPQTRRQLRDYLFEAIVDQNAVEEACEILDTTQERLLYQIELFIEGIDPQFLIFIDDTNQDLNDMAQALSAPVRIFRVQKFIVNDQVEYHSPDIDAPVLSTEPLQEPATTLTEYEVVELLGGGEHQVSEGRFKIYQMQDGSIVHIKRSKYYPRHDYYWYGITPSALERSIESGVTHIVYVMGEEGFAKIPIQTVQDFVANTRTSDNKDGTVRYYHCLISSGPQPELYYSQEIPRFDLSDHYQAI